MAFKHFWVQYKFSGGSKQAYIKAKAFTVGRAKDCDLTIPSDAMSRRHLKVKVDDKKVVIKDLGSTNGTFLNGERLVENIYYEYRDGQQIYIDVNKECTIKVSPIYSEESAELTLADADKIFTEVDAMDDVSFTGLEPAAKKKKKRSVEKKSERRPTQPTMPVPQNSVIAPALPETDNLVDDLLYVVKNARYNREKKIREAEKQARAFFDRARNEIEEFRVSVERETLELQQKTDKEVGRQLAEVEKAKKDTQREAKVIVKKAQMEADRLKKQSEKAIEMRESESLAKAQEKYGEIIADAAIKNRELIADNESLLKKIESHRNEAQKTADAVAQLKLEEHNSKNLRDKSQQDCEKTLKDLEELRIQTEELQKLNTQARHESDVTLPALKKEEADLKTKIQDNSEILNGQEEEISKSKDAIAEYEQRKEQALAKSNKAEQRLDELSEKVLVAENNLIELARQRKEQSTEMDRELAEKRLQLKLLEDDANESMEKRWDLHHKEIKEAQEQAEKQCQEILNEAAAGKAELIQEGEEQANRVQDMANDYSARVMEEVKQLKQETEKEIREMTMSAERQSLDLEKNAKSAAERVESEAHAKAKRLKKEAESAAEALRVKTQDESQVIKEEAQKYADNLRNDIDKVLADRKAEQDRLGQEEIESLKASAQKEADATLTAARTKASHTVSEAEAKAAHLVESTEKACLQKREQAEKEIEKKQRATDKEIESLRKKTLKQLDNKRKDFEQELVERDRIRSLRLKKELQEVIRARLTPYISSEDGYDKMDQLVGASVNAILLDEVESQSFVEGQLSDVDPSFEQERVKKFWKYAGAGLAGFLLLLFMLPRLGDVAKDSGRQLAAVDKAETKKQIEKVQKENNLSKIFNPPQVQEYKSSYTERVLYTDHYSTIELNKEYREEWILALQDFFVHKLRLDENNLVPFIAQEANLIRELLSARKKINGNFIDPGVERMEEIEAAFVAKLKKNIKKDSDFKKIMTFKKEFFETHRKKYQP